MMLCFSKIFGKSEWPKLHSYLILASKLKGSVLLVKRSQPSCYPSNSVLECFDLSEMEILASVLCNAFFESEKLKRLYLIL